MRDKITILGDVFKLEVLAQSLAGSRSELVTGAKHGSSDNHHLAAMLVIEAMLALAGKNMSSHMGNVTKRNGSELVVLANGNGKHTLRLGLVGVREEVLSIEAGAFERLS